MWLILFFLSYFLTITFCDGYGSSDNVPNSSGPTLPSNSSSKSLARILYESDREAKTVFDERSNKKLAAFMEMHANCSRSSWYCYPQCRIRPNNPSKNRCSQPAPGAKCFDVNITYTYVLPDPNIVSLLPRYEVLSRFPRCWTVLAPLICAVTYRPCTVRYSFQSYRDEEKKLELWQLFRWSMCDRATLECSFLKDWGLWPDFINCTNTSLKEPGDARLFADRSCQMNYKEEAANFERNQCLWPLIKSEEVFRDAKPVIDDCYLPCHSTLVSSVWTRSTFKVKILILSAVISFILLVSFVYLSVFSDVWRTNMCAYALGHTTFSGFLYYFLWLLSFFNWFAESAMCFGNGDLRRTNNNTLGKAIGWCGMQSFLMQTVFFSANFWLCIFFVLCIGRPRVRADHKILIDGRPDWSLRCVLLVIYLIAAITALPAFWSSKNDGLLGVCYVGLLTTDDRLWTYLPIMFAAIVAFLLAGLLLLFRRAGKPTEVTTEKLGQNCCYGKATLKSDVNESRVLVPIELPKGSSKDEASGEESIDDGFASGQISETPEKEELISGQSGISDSSKQVDGNKIDDCGFTAVPTLFLGAIIVLYVFFLSLSLIIHARNEWEPETEKNLVLNSQRCSLNASILEGKNEWFTEARHYDHFVSSVDPLVRKKLIGSRFLNAPGCDLLPLLDDYFHSSLLMYILLPSLPFLAVAALLITGCCGIGFKNIEKIREHLNPFVRSTNSTDSELQEICKNDYTGLERMANFSSSGCVASLCDDRNVSARPFSSVDCVNRMCSSANSIPSQINSEPVKLTSAKPHVRKLNFKRLAQHRLENARRTSSVQSTGGSSYSTNTQQQMFASQRSSAVSLGSEVPSVYSHDFGNCFRSCNTTSASQMRDSNVEGATIFSAYQSGLIEGFWQQMCHEASGKIKTLVDCLQQAEDEIRRLSGQVPSNASPDVSSAPFCSSNIGFPSQNGLPFVGLSLLQASGLAPSFQNGIQNTASSVCIPLFPASTRSETVEAHEPILNNNTTLSSRGEKSAKMADSKNGVSVDESSHKLETERVNETKDFSNQETIEDKESMQSVEADSNSFVSDEEDEEEAKLWEQKSESALCGDIAGPSKSSGSAAKRLGQEMGSERTFVSTDSRSSSGDSESTSNNTGHFSKHYILPSLKPPSHLQHRESGNMTSQEERNRSGAAQLGAQNNVMSFSQQLLGPQQPNRPCHGPLFGNSRPLATVANHSVNPPVVQNVNAVPGPGAAAVRPVLLTEEQARGLLNLRNQLTGRDLLFYSNRLREEAMRRLGNQEFVPQQRLQRWSNQHQSNGQAEPIREEEDVPDPFSSSDGPENNSSHATSGSSRTQKFGDQNRNGTGGGSGNG